MKLSAEFEGIEKATLAIALDNGGINRERSVEQQKQDLYRWLLREHRTNRLAAFDRFLLSLSDNDLDTLCAGEEAAQTVIASFGPPGLNDFLNDYFEKVC